MNQFTKEIAEALCNHTNLTDIFRQQLESTINTLLESELTSALGYDPYARNEGDNARNGEYTRRLDTQFGQIQVRVPRDRKGDFKQSLLPPYKHRIDALETTVIQLYEKGITTREIADLIEKMYGAHYSPTTVSNITKIVDEQVEVSTIEKFAIISTSVFFLMLPTFLLEETRWKKKQSTLL